jgi:hypothetical protein
MKSLRFAIRLGAGSVLRVRDVNKSLNACALRPNWQGLETSGRFDLYWHGRKPKVTS